MDTPISYIVLRQYIDCSPIEYGCLRKKYMQVPVNISRRYGLPRNKNFKAQNKNKMNSKTRPKQMLTLGKLDYFKYDLKEIMERSGMDEDKVTSFTATMTARARQRSIMEAKDYILEVEKRGDITRETSDRLCRLLDRYTKYR